MYSKNSKDFVEKKINKDMDLIIREILDAALDVSSIVLTGGFGRDEGSVLIDGLKCQPLNDYDITIIAEKWKDDIDINLLRVKLAELCGIRQVDLSLKTKKEILSLKYTMANYDFINASKVVYGDTDWSKHAPEWDSSNMPLVEGILPLFLFLSSIIQAYPKETKISKENLFWSYQQLTKSILGWSTAMLVFDGLYDPSYQKRNVIFQDNYGHNKKLCNLVEKATAFKLMPVINPCKKNEIQKFWNDATKAHLEVMKEILSRFYKIQFKNWDTLIHRHKYSFKNILKSLLSIFLRRHHHKNCLDTDIAKLYMCLSIINNSDEYFKKSQQYYKKLKIVEKVYNPSIDKHEFISQLIMSDINASIFFEQGNIIYYE
tara:strand:+ start:5900 stop:7021 length:1122 start_codon:yes stop_codon:yes gene_type:complete